MSAPRLALIGAGKMGHAVAQLARERGWPIVATIDSASNANASGITARSLGGAQVAIEFTTPAAAPGNVMACARAGCPVVSGTTGWEQTRVDVEREVLASGGTLFWSPNFSIGVNLFWQVAEDAARLVGRIGGFDAHIVETHHAAKKDAPSGTAIELHRRARGGFAREIPITSVRVGSVPGTHELVFDAAFEQLRIEHIARDRRVFAEGALAAARWVIGRQGVFTMRDMLTTEASSA